MVSSGRHPIVAFSLLLCAIFSANAQTAVDKASTSTISGKVTLGGKGISGLVVGLSTETSFTSIYITRMRAVTDEDGNYRIKNVPPGTYKVLVSALTDVPGDRLTSITVGKDEVIENIDITLVRGGVITGKVTDADGRPVVEEQISFSSTTPSRGFPYFRIIRTDDRGVYRAFGLPAGRYIVSAGRDSVSSFGRAATEHLRTYHPSTHNAAEATPIEVNEGSEATNVDITLDRQVTRYTARGRIIDGETSQPLPNTRIGVQLFYGDNNSGSTSSGTAAESTKDGEFKIENLPPGKYAVYLDSQADAERFSEPVRFELIDQDVEGLLIGTSKGGTASGMVVLDGPHDPKVKANLAGTQIVASVSNEYYGRTQPSATINPDGSFRLTGLPAGRLTLDLPYMRGRLQLVRLERDGVVSRSSIDIKDREQITGLRVVVSQANGTIRGVLKFPEGWAVPAQARLQVWVRRTDDPAANILPVEPDARSQFLVQGLVAGTYEFLVRVVGVPSDQLPRIPKPAQTVVVTNGAIADVTITLQMLKPGPGGP
jgi:Carboxypeptidase regulatory-like domain